MYFPPSISIHQPEPRSEIANTAATIIAIPINFSAYSVVEWNGLSKVRAMVIANSEDAIPCHTAQIQAVSNLPIPPPKSLQTVCQFTFRNHQKESVNRARNENKTKIAIAETYLTWVIVFPLVNVSCGREEPHIKFEGTIYDYWIRILCCQT